MQHVKHFLLLKNVSMLFWIVAIIVEQLAANQRVGSLILASHTISQKVIWLNKIGLWTFWWASFFLNQKKTLSQGRVYASSIEHLTVYFASNCRMEQEIQQQIRASFTNNTALVYGGEEWAELEIYWSIYISSLTYGVIWFIILKNNNNKIQDTSKVKRSWGDSSIWFKRLGLFSLFVFIPLSGQHYRLSCHVRASSCLPVIILPPWVSLCLLVLILKF